MRTLKSKLINLIKDQGPLGLDQFMDLVLYDPECGYYHQREPAMLGRDFITAPEMGEIFADALSVWLKPAIELNHIEQVIELGPGSGALAQQLGSHWRDLIRTYYCVEKSIGLQAYQKDTLSGPIHYEWGLADLDPQPSSLVIANEFLDALPAKRIYKREDDCLESCIDFQNHFKWHAIPTDIQLEHFGSAEGVCDVIDYNPLFEMLKPLAHSLVVLIDYGYHASEYIAHPQLRDSLRGFYRNQVIHEPWQHLGQMDLTVDINFSRLAFQAEAEGWQVISYFRQSELIQLLMKQGLERTYDPYQIKQLMYPTQMGERVRVMVLSRQSSLVHLNQIGLERL